MGPIGGAVKNRKDISKEYYLPKKGPVFPQNRKELMSKLEKKVNEAELSNKKLIDQLKYEEASFDSSLFDD